MVERDLLHELVLLIPVGVIPRQRTKRLLVLAPANEESGGLADEPEKGELDDTRKHLEELKHGHQVNESQHDCRTTRYTKTYAGKAPSPIPVDVQGSETGPRGDDRSDCERDRRKMNLV